MFPYLALLLWLALLFILLCFDPAKSPGTSWKLWVPIAWMFIAASRLPSQWLGVQGGGAAQRLQDGSLVDSTIYSVLIVLAIGILISRSFPWGEFVLRNVALVGFLLFALVSVLWSDFPFIALKRWFRDLGSYWMVLVILSDPRPLDAIRTVMRRLSYILIPLSIVLIKYFPNFGKEYEVWTGQAHYLGVATSKNGLGSLCLVSGLFFFWDTVTRWADRSDQQTKRVILINLVFLAMTLWLLSLSDSATSRTCLLLGCLIIAAARTDVVKRHPNLLKVLAPLGVGSYLILVFGFDVDINAIVAQIVGRDPTLTGRTEIWKNLLSMHTDPLLGTGYESFWLGERLDWVWQRCGDITEAHNGYLDIYLNLGLIGLSLLVAFLISSYRTICRRLEPIYSLGVAIWTVLLFYSVSEAAFKSGLIWMMVLFGGVVVPERRTVQALYQAKQSSDEGFRPELERALTL